VITGTEHRGGQYGRMSRPHVLSAPGVAHGPRAGRATLVVAVAFTLALAAGCGSSAHPTTDTASADASTVATDAAITADSTGTAPPAAPSPTAPAPTPSTKPTAAAPTTLGAPGPAPAELGALAGRTVAIDPGHNGGNGAHASDIARLVPAGGFMKACDTTGTATNAGYSEAAFNFAVASDLQAILTAAGAHVVLTRTDDTGWGPCIDERARIGNDAHADVAISIHADGAGPNDHGFHVISVADGGYAAAIAAPSALLATDVRDAFLSGTGEPVSNYAGADGLIRRTDLGGLNLSTVPKVLIECANMRNAGDAARLVDPSWQHQAAVALAQGLAAYLASR